MRYDPLSIGTIPFTGEMSKEKAQAYMRSVIATLRAQAHFHQVGREEGQMAIYGEDGAVLCKIVEINRLQGPAYHISGNSRFREQFEEQLPYI